MPPRKHRTKDGRDVHILSDTPAQVTNAMIRIMTELKPTIASPAIAFDVDDTLIYWNNDTAVSAHPFGKHLFNHAKKLGYKIFIITARGHTTGALAYMVRQLMGTGYDVKTTVPHGGMFMTPASYRDDDHPGRFKSDARTSIEKKFGVQIVAMVGDKFWDMIRVGDPPVDLDNTKMAHLILRPDTNAMFGVKLPSVDGDD